MSPEELIQRRVALELHPGTLVNLGIGLPTGVSRYVPLSAGILFQSENGIVGMGSPPPDPVKAPERRLARSLALSRSIVSFSPVNAKAERRPPS